MGEFSDFIKTLNKVQEDTCEAVISLVMRNKPKKFSKREKFNIIGYSRNTTLLIKYKKKVLGAVITKINYPKVECYFDEDVKSI